MLVRSLKTGILILIAATQYGCVTSQNLRSEDHAAIHSVYVDESVKLPPEPFVLTREQGWTMGLGGAIGGAAGGAIAGSASGGGPKGTQAYLEKNDIHVDAMLFDSFKDELNKRQLFASASSAADADAVVHLEIVLYGIGYTANMFSHDYRAAFGAKATMTRAGGKVVWIKQTVDTSMNGDRATATWSDIYTKPDVMREQMLVVARSAAHEMVMSLPAN